MKSRHRALRLTCAAVTLLATGCTTLREIPRGEYAARAERRDVRVTTVDGLQYEFDYAHFAGDSIVGYRRRDVEGAFDEYAVLHVPLGDVDRLSARVVDWYRTGLIGGGILVSAITAGLATQAGDDRTSSSGGGKGVVP